MNENVFDYLDKRILSYYHEALLIKKGGFPEPRFMILYPTNICPFNCTFCDYADLNKKHPKKYLNENQWKYILDQFKLNGGMAIELCGGGEPLSTPDIDKLIVYAYKIGLKIGILTSGYNIKYGESIYNAILKYCSYLRVSFEAGSTRMFNEIKRPKTHGEYFNTILGNITDLIGDRNLRNHPLQISYKYTIGSRFIIDDIKSACKFAEEFKFDSIQFKPACNVGKESFPIDNNYRRAYAHEILIASEKILKNTKLVLGFEKYNLKRSIGCFMSAVHTTIDYNGDVFICCYYRHRVKKHCIGNIFKNRFYDIWHSYEHTKKMNEVNIDECNLYDCRFIKYNMIMDNALTTGQLEFI